MGSPSSCCRVEGKQCPLRYSNKSYNLILVKGQFLPGADAGFRIRTISALQRKLTSARRSHRQRWPVDTRSAVRPEAESRPSSASCQTRKFPAHCDRAEECMFPVDHRHRTRLPDRMRSGDQADCMGSQDFIQRPGTDVAHRRIATSLQAPRHWSQVRLTRCRYYRNPGAGRSPTRMQ